MKIKLPVTDQFLWLIYNVFEKTGEILEPPEVFKVKLYPSFVSEDRDFLKSLERKRKKKQFAQFINHLKRQGYIKIANLKEKRGMLLTPKGKEKALKVKIELTNKKRRKDKKWIMVMYDIPEKKKNKRAILREFLASLGYQKFQNSIWVCPYDVFKQTEEIIRVHSLDPYVRIFLIEEVEL